MPAPAPWRVLASHVVVDNPWYPLRRDTVELPDGRVLDDYFVALRPDVAVVVAVTAIDEVLLARQYKHGIGEITLELPGGSIEPGERPEAAAERELSEELGYSCAQLEPLGTLLHAPSNATNRIYGFLGLSARAVGARHLDPSEEIVVESVPLTEVEARIRAGTIAATDTVAFLMLAFGRINGYAPAMAR